MYAITIIFSVNRVDFYITYLLSTKVKGEINYEAKT